MATVSEVKTKKVVIFDYALYTWARDPFSILIISFIFAPYFEKVVAVNPVIGTAQWGWTMAIVAVVVAIFGTISGAIADVTGNMLKPLALVTILNIVATALLFFIAPLHADRYWALVLMAIALFAFELSYVYYNGMLKSMTVTENIGKISGIAWSAGYWAGIISLIIALFGIVDSKIFPSTGAYDVRTVALLSAAWFIIFSWPMFVTSKNKRIPRAEGAPPVIKEAFSNLGEMFRDLKGYSVFFRFIIARLFYIDGVNTMLMFAGIFANQVYGFSIKEIIYFAIAANIAAGIGTLIFGYIDDWLGPRFVLFWTAAISIACGIVIFYGAPHPIVFWIAGCVFGAVAGAVQASSRSYLTHISPKKLVVQMFGLYSLAGRATAFIGPLLGGIFAYEFKSIRGIALVAAGLIVIGLIIVMTLPATKNFCYDKKEVDVKHYAE